jgi:hypothetical protein
VRVIDGIGEFYDRLTDEKFTPRGYNYVHIAPMSPSDPSLWHSTLNPGFYDPLEVEAAFGNMQAFGYNTVRAFIDCCRTGNNVGDPAGGISPAYIDNLEDFLGRAAAHEIFVLLVMDLIPADGGYNELWDSCCSTFDGNSLRYMTAGGHSAKRRSLQDIITALIDRDARLDLVLGYDLTNEVFFEKNLPPLTMTVGSVQTVNGKTYNLSDPA